MIACIAEGCTNAAETALHAACVHEHASFAFPVCRRCHDATMAAASYYLCSRCLRCESPHECRAYFSPASLPVEVYEPAVTP